MHSPGSLKERLRELVPVIVDASDLHLLTSHALRDDKPDASILIAFGKASVPMARAAVELLGDRVEGGVVVIPKWRSAEKISGLEVIQASHPIPDEDSLRAGEAVVEWARSSAGKGLIVLVSGGGSALVEKPQPGLTIDDIVEATRQRRDSGANIHEINTVRKHLSLVKGGWLAKHASPGPVYGFYASDVPGDRLESIASGPTVPDPTTYGDALRVVDKYGLRDKMPERVIEVLEEGLRGLRPETPKPGDAVFGNVSNRLVASNLDVLRRLASFLEGQGYNAIILTSRLDGESREAGRILASIALEAYERGIPVETPAALILGGETTVTVRNPGGKGGRNQELALAWLVSVDYWLGGDRVMGLLAMDTDGIDGNSDAAGAIVVSGDTGELRLKGLDPGEYLDSNNSYEALKAIDGLIVTGPLDSNLNSVVVVLVEKGAGG